LGLNLQLAAASQREVVTIAFGLHFAQTLVFVSHQNSHDTAQGIWSACFSSVNKQHGFASVAICGTTPSNV